MTNHDLVGLTDDERTFVQGPSLGPTMYFCTKCREYKYPGYFSMSSFYAPAGMIKQEGGGKRICNECRIESPAIRSFSRDIETPDWTKAACKDDPEWDDHFFEGDLTKGAEICADCPLRTGCLQYGLQSQSVGLWGGQLLTGNGKTVLGPEAPSVGRPPLKDTCMKGGHPWTEDNTGFDAAGKRYCMACRRKRDVERWAGEREARAVAKVAG